MSEIAYYILVGFIAQIIDGTLGMAFGLSSSTLLLYRGLPPAIVSATVHTAELFTTSFSGISHHFFGNVDRRLFLRLAVPGVIGAVIGAYVLTHLPGERLRPLVALYLLCMGFLIILRAAGFVHKPSPKIRYKTLGFFGALIDVIGGGGWGPIVTSTLIASGKDARQTVGSVNAAEFFVTFAASVAFLFTIGIQHWRVILGLGIGGMIAAPLGALACRKIPHRPFMFIVGALVVFISLLTLKKALGM